MYIIKDFNNDEYPYNILMLEQKYIPCFCKIKFDYFEINFSINIFENIKLVVSDFDIDQIGLYAPIGAGGEWLIYNRGALVTLRKSPDNPNKLEFVDLAFFDVFTGWFWAIKNGEYTKDYVGKDDKEYLNRIIYPLQD